jgi:predicted nuclease of restriction endonuclease-like (RecB) superfamily
MGRQLYDRVRGIIESARAGAARSVDTAQVVSNWLIGREIVEEEQKGEKRAAYGRRILEKLSVKLLAEYGKGYSVQNLQFIRRFSINFPDLLWGSSISYPLGRKFGPIRYPVGSELDVPQENRIEAIPHPPGAQSWRPGRLNMGLAWRHYRALLGVEERPKRDFYEIEAVKNGWSGRELERQINSLLYERVALSKDKAGVMELATKGQEIAKPGDVFKDPMVLDFLGVPVTSKLTESDLEEALIVNMQRFLLELGRGFAFVARQERLTLDGDLFFVDLVFYHAVLKCYALVELKVGKLTHQDLGQMLFYVNYFDRERRTEGDGPTLGLILCTDKNDAVVRYTLGEANEAIFASRYKLYLPSEAELREEVRREVRLFREISPTPDAT